MTRAIIDRERLFIQKQKLLAESIELLDEFMGLSMNLKFGEAKKIRERIDKINEEIQNHEEVAESLILDMVMGVEEASEKWELSSGHIKNLCAKGKVNCRKIGKAWILYKDQPNPKQRGLL